MKVQGSLSIAWVVLLLPLTAAGEWEICNPRPLAGEILSLSSPSAGLCWASDEYGGAVVTRDGGESWNPAGFPYVEQVTYYFDFETARNGWALATGGSDLEPPRLHWTSDSGESWSSVALEIQNSLFNAHCLEVEGGIAYVGGFDAAEGLPAVFRYAGNQLSLAHLPEGTHRISDLYSLSGRSVWAVGEGGYFAFSPNRGEDWEGLETGLNVPLYCVHFTDVMTGYIAGGTFNRPVMSKTANGGRNWQAVENLPVTSRFAAMTPHPNGGVGAISRGGGDDSRAALIFSRNWREWRSLLSMEEFFSALSFDGVDFWVGGKNGLLLKTADGVSIEEPGRRVTTEDLLDVDFADDRQGWAVGTGATVLISSNGGKDWRIPEHFPGWDPVGVAAITSERVIVHCRSAVELASDDGGESWEEIEISRSVVTKITRRGGALLASTEAGVAYSDDAGRSWTDLNWGVAPSDVAIADESRFYAAFQNGAAKVSRDGGENWEETDAVPRNCSRIFQFDANHGWANCVTDSGAFLWVTRDGWENRIATPGYEQVHDWAFITPRKGWISYQSGGDNFVRTVNAGFTDESDAYGGGKITAIASLDSTRLWICGYGGFIARLILDEQGTPVVTPLPVSTSLLLAYPNPSNGWVNVLWQGRPQGIGGVSLYDSGGRSLRTFVVGPDGAFSFDAGGLPSGSYLLRVTGESSGSLMIRIAK